jgi:sugar phosphate isomerase/epimerase
MSTRPLIGLQLYTVRDHVAEHMEETLRKVAAMGYEGIEVGGSFGEMDSGSMKRLCDELKLKVIAMHASIDALQNNFDKTVEDALLLDTKYVIIAWSGEEYRSREGALTLAKILNEQGAKLNSSGLQLLYHNHDFEFVKYDGETMFDILLSNTDANLVKAEVDSFWVQKGGGNAADFIRQHKGRVPLVHIKDMTNDERETFAEIGEGKMNWPEIFAASEEGDVYAYVVEQDKCEREPLESIQISIDNLKKMGKL